VGGVYTAGLLKGVIAVSVYEALMIALTFGLVIIAIINIKK